MSDKKQKKLCIYPNKIVEFFNYESVEPFDLKLIDNTAIKDKNYKFKVKLKANKMAGEIQLDEQTLLWDIPESTWVYKLGNRSRLSGF